MAYQGYEGYGSPNLTARERAALALLNRQRKAPANIGEGLFSIGESIADTMTMKRMEQEEAARREQSRKDFETYGRDTAPAAPMPPSRPEAAAEPTFAPATRGATALTPIEEGGYNILEAEADQREARRNAIAGGETGGRADPYGTRHAVTPSGDRAYGRYGIMGQNIPQWSQAALGQQMTPQQFLGDKAAQNVIFDEKFGDYVKKYGEEGAARAWFAGERGMRNPNATDMHGRVNVAQYGQNYLNRLDPREQAARTMVDMSARSRPDSALAAAYNRTAEPAPGVPPVNPTMPGAQPPVATPPVPLTTPAAGPGGPPPPNPQMAQAPQAALPPNQGIRLAPPPQALQPPSMAVQPLPRVESNRPPEAQEQPPTPAEIAAQRYMSHPDPALATRAKADFDRLYETRMRRLQSDLIESRAAQQRWDIRQADAPKREAEERKTALEIQRLERELPTQPNAPAGQGFQLAGGGQDFRLLGTPQSPQRSGIPTLPPTPAGVSPKDWSEKQVPELVKATVAVEKASPTFRDMIKTIDLARNHPGKKWGTGALSGITTRTPNTPAFDFNAVNEQLKGKNFLVGYEKLKGGGQITEVEGTKTEQAQARLATAGTTKAYDDALNDLEIAVRGDLETVQRKVNQPVTAWRGKGDNESYAPDIGERRGNKEYVGGNPSLPESWRRAQ